MSWKLALRNIFRSKLRSIITLSAIAFGCAALIIAAGFIEDSVTRMTEYYLRAFLGHHRIARKGFFEKGLTDPYQYMISNPERVIQKIKTIKGIQEVTPRIEFQGMLSTGQNTIGFLAQAVNPEAENQASPNFKVIEGRNLTSQDTYGVILGRGMAESVNVHPGDSVTLVVNTVGGGINALDLTVQGIFQTISKNFDDHALRVILPTGQQLLRTQDIQTVTVFLTNTFDTDHVRGELTRLFKDPSLDLDVRAWYDLPDADFVLKVTPFYRSIFGFLRVIILAMVILSIFNTMNMSVLERIGEIGTIAAFGHHPRAIISLFLKEGLFMGVFGSVLGLIGGLVLGRLISWLSIPMPIAPGSTMQWYAKILILPQACLSATVLVILATVLSAYYPAFKASRLEVADALRHNL